MLDNGDIQVLRALAARYAEYAALPVQQEKRRLWTALNTGRRTRPMILVDQLPWHELDTDGSLRCQVEDPYWQEVERRLRRRLYQWEHVPVDMVLDPYLPLYVPVQWTGWGIEIDEDLLETEAGNDVVSHHFNNQIETLEDLEKIHQPTIRRDHAAEALVRQQADLILEGILPYRMCGARGEGYGFRVGPWDWITEWMGVTDLYYDFVEEPELIHALMEKMTGCLVNLIDQYNREGLFDAVTNSVHCSMTYSDALPGPDCDTDHAQSKDAWGFGLAQLMTSVSPAMTEEFEVAYMQRVFPLMGAVYYGCCERLDDRLDVISKLPNIRKVSCSPWSDREHFAEALPDAYVMSNKPLPALLAEDRFSLDCARADVRRTIEAAHRHGRRLEIILKDVSTLRHEPQRLWDWARMAMEEAQRLD